MTAIHGYTTPRFAGVRTAFEENFARRAEVGAAVCVWHEGEKVVDLWGGIADPTTGRPWQAHTLGVLFSATKGLAALALNMLVDRGELDPDAPVARYWPAFATAGKSAVTVRQLLDHRAGLCAIDEPISLDDLEDPDRVAPKLEAQEPLWEPGEDQGYHGVSFGPYAGELFRRVAGRSLGTFLRDEVAGPLEADVHLGLPPSEERRVARLIPVRKRDRLLRVIPSAIRGKGVEGRLFRAFLDKSSETRRAFANPAELGAAGIDNFNRPRVHRMELPWANGIATARGLARVYAALAEGGALDGARLLSSERVDRLQERPHWQVDRVLRKPVGWNLGFLKEEGHLFSPFPESFGHPGAGGVLGWADPPRGLAIAYVMNRMDWRLRSPRAVALCHATYDAL